MGYRRLATRSNKAPPSTMSMVGSSGRCRRPQSLIADDCYLSMPFPISSATSSATESPRPPHRLGPGSSSRRTPSAPPPAIT
uniref:Uncharacterized protein n=1 Tax=Oryza barthii TaxID=65489 RepID=A0A0D3H3M9_9ORYZ